MTDTAEAIETVSNTKLEKPKRYKVILHNDDKTSMDFVISVLMKIFNKSFEDSMQLMLTIHESGSGVAGEYSLDIAETKVHETSQYAELNGFPLLATCEEI